MVRDRFSCALHRRYFWSDCIAVCRKSSRKAVKCDIEARRRKMQLFLLFSPKLRQNRCFPPAAFPSLHIHPEAISDVFRPSTPLLRSSRHFPARSAIENIQSATLRPTTRQERQSALTDSATATPVLRMTSWRNYVKDSLFDLVMGGEAGDGPRRAPEPNGGVSGSKEQNCKISHSCPVHDFSREQRRSRLIIHSIEVLESCSAPKQGEFELTFVPLFSHLLASPLSISSNQSLPTSYVHSRWCLR